MPRSSKSAASPQMQPLLLRAVVSPNENFIVSECASPECASPLIEPLVIGIDVCRATLDIAHGDKSYPVANNQKAIDKWLGKLPAGCSIALESTNTYHQLVADLAFQAGHTVYVLNPQHIHHYRTAAAVRAKTDLKDARLIARYLEAERAHLRSYTPMSPPLRRLHILLHRRATIVKTRSQLRLSLGKDTEALELEHPWLLLLESYENLIDTIDKQMDDILKTSELQEKAARLRSITGFGLLSTSALLIALERGEFKSSDALVAYFGLDPRPRDSGQSRGKRRLSKQGDGEVRRILFNAARSASSTVVWKAFYKRYRDRGLADVETLCIVARKMVRVAWSLYKHEKDFCPTKITDLTPETLT